MLYLLGLALLFVSGLSKLCKEDKECMKDHIYSDSMTSVMKLITEERVECRLAGTCPNNQQSIIGAPVACSGGMSGPYPCNNVDMLSYISLTDLGASSNANGNDIWGWYDTITGDYWAITGQEDSSSYVKITDPENPVVYGKVASEVSANTVWRDIKVYNDYAFIVADDRLNNHAMQIVDLTQLRSISNPSANNYLTINNVYREFGSCHNIVINEASGYAYAVGTRTCSGGLHIVNIQDPTNPFFEGCFSLDGYTHDAECITYNGPDSPYVGREVCFGYNEDTLTVVDVTNHASPTQISRTGYPGSSYTHQGWITSDHQYILLDDELDELNGLTNGGHTRTFVWDVRDLDNPIEMGYIDSPVVSIDHNLYIDDNNLAWLSNYEAGLRIYDVNAIVNSNPLTLTELGYFDVYPEADSLSFLGSWSSYPYFHNEAINAVVVQSIDRGLFVLRYNPTSDEDKVTPLTFTKTQQ